LQARKKNKSDNFQILKRRKIFQKENFLNFENEKVSQIRQQWK